MLTAVKEKALYRNIKTKCIYQVIAIGIHSETEESMVVYQRFHEPNGQPPPPLTVWVRPMELFKQKFEALKQ